MAGVGCVSPFRKEVVIKTSPCSRFDNEELRTNNE